jgi:hypothetical protein
LAVTAKRTLLREVNERIRELNAVLTHGIERYHVVCECGGSACFLRVVVPCQVYETSRLAEQRFLVAPGHEDAGGDRVVSSDGYRIVTV